jgi:hypothetical protein
MRSRRKGVFMLLFDDSKRLERALGEEAAAVIVHVFEKMGAENKRELATKADLDLRLAETEAKLMAEIAKSKSEMIKWVAGMLVAQSAITAALVKLL